MKKCYVCETTALTCYQTADLDMCSTCEVKVATVVSKMCGGPMKDKILKAVLEVRSTLRTEGAG